jgi:cyclohexadieny/prephenate dehydrogenase
MTVRTLAIVGVGLMGGSIALAARARGVAQRVVGVGPSAASLERALHKRIVDQWSTDVAEVAADAEVMVSCTPVDQVIEQVVAAAGRCGPEALLTDVGSTKAFIVRGLQKRLPAAARFVGSHPLAGSEKRGADHADARLLEGRLVVVTPADQTDAETVQRAATFWQALGARVVQMSPEDHDRALALTSHVPHLIAAVLAGVLPADLHHLTASGFRDTTRVAAGDPSLWTGIFLSNRDAIVQALAGFEDGLARFRTALEAGDRAGIDDLLQQGKRSRDALGS